MDFNYSSPTERALSSILIGNISAEITEDVLKELFSKAGPFVSFKLLYDQKTGLHSGYAFCEYKTQDIAVNAIRNLNGFELHGKKLNVDSALSEKSIEEMKQIQASESSKSTSQVEPEKSSENISKAVASLPAEQMFELMKQIKICIQNNPNEARSLLLQNPQLSYALLQAAVVMRIVDPKIAMSILNRPNPPAFETQNTESEATKKTLDGIKNMMSSDLPTPSSSQNIPVSANMEPSSISNPRIAVDHDMRQMPPLVNRDFRMQGQPLMGGDQDMRQLLRDQDMRQLPQIESRPFDPRFRGMTGGEAYPSMQRPSDPRMSVVDPRTAGAAVDPRIAYDKHSTKVVTDPRNVQPVPRPVLGVPFSQPPVHTVDIRPQSSIPNASNFAPDGQHKAALIMQVLQLTDQQIASLPPDQRQSILFLKEQIARGMH